jgi:membrane protease YdiL (CAAX protease family)
VTERRPDGRPDEQQPAQSPAPPTPDGRSRRPVFSLENRPVPGLYAVAWLLTVSGVAIFLIALSVPSGAARAVIALLALLLAAVGLSAGAGYQIAARRARPAGMYRGPSPLLAFAIVFAVVSLAAAPLELVGLDPSRTTSEALPFQVLLALGYFGVLAIFVVRTGAFRWSEMTRPGSRAWSTVRVVGDVLAAIAVMPGAYLAILILANVLATAAGVDVRSPIPFPTGPADVASIVLLTLVLAPVGEEFFFRGFSLTAWERDLGTRAALIRSSVFFAAAHLLSVTAASAREGLLVATIELAVYVPLGLVLGWLFVRRGIVASIAGHAAANGTTLLLYALAAPRGGT